MRFRNICTCIGLLGLLIIAPPVRAICTTELGPVEPTLFNVSLALGILIFLIAMGMVYRTLAVRASKRGVRIDLWLVGALALLLALQVLFSLWIPIAIADIVKAFFVFVTRTYNEQGIQIVVVQLILFILLSLTLPVLSIPKNALIVSERNVHRALMLIGLALSALARLVPAWAFQPPLPPAGRIPTEGCDGMLLFEAVVADHSTKAVVALLLLLASAFVCRKIARRVATRPESPIPAGSPASQ